MTSDRAVTLWPPTNASQNGSAAFMPAVSGTKPGGRLARVDPGHAVRQAPQALHLATDDDRLAALPAVGDDDDDGAACQAAAPVAVVEALQRQADLRAA
jgi:hypothetical protein